MTDEEILTQVDERKRSDGTYYIKDKSNSEDFIFAAHDETIIVRFDQVSASIEVGHEWADFINSEGTFDVTLSNQKEEKWPHWIFEEFSHIELEGELRPIEDYDERYQLADNRGIKGT